MQIVLVEGIFFLLMVLNVNTYANVILERSLSAKLMKVILMLMRVD